MEKKQKILTNVNFLFFLLVIIGVIFIGYNNSEKINEYSTIPISSPKESPGEEEEQVDIKNEEEEIEVKLKSGETLKAQKINLELCSDYLNDKPYFICCRDNKKLTDCNQKQSFSSGEAIEIALNPQKFDIPETFYVCFASDLLDYATKQPKEEQCFIGNKYTATWLMTGIVPKNKQEFNLLKVTGYPNSNFNKSQEQLLINLTGKVEK